MLSWVKKRLSGWVGQAAIFGLALLLGVVVTASVMRPQPQNETKTTTTVNEVVRTVERTERIVLVTLGIEGIVQRSVQGKFFGVDIPGSDRNTFLQYKYRASLGIEGSAVTIKEVSEKKYRITIPKFIFIGHSNEEFKVLLETNGVLSAATPEIDTAALITEMLSTEAKQGQIEANQSILEDQARNFYQGIVRAVDPEIELEFVFADAS